jgi:hypothetical protein
MDSICMRIEASVRDGARASCTRHVDDNVAYPRRQREHNRKFASVTGPLGESHLSVRPVHSVIATLV